MKLRRNTEDATIQGRCTACGEWHALSDLYLSPRGNRLQREGGEYRVSLELDRTLAVGRVMRFEGVLHRIANSDLFRSHCRRCESIRARERRSNGTRPRATGRYFGIELELTGPSASTVIGALQSAEVPVRFIGQYRSTSGAGNVWELKSDGSVHGHGLELVSPKLRGAEGFATLRRVMYALQSVNATVDASCGMHVHVDFSGMDVTTIKRQVLGVLANQPNMLAMNAPSRRTNLYCPSWRPEQVEALRNFVGTDLRTSHFGPRGVVNFGSYARHGSVEFRSHGGTTSYAKASAWVKFLLKALERSGELGGLPTFETPEQMLNSLGMDADDKATLLRFEQAAQNLEASEYAGDAEDLPDGAYVNYTRSNA